MKFNKRILRVVTKKYKQDPTEILVLLWDISGSKFDYLKNEDSVIKQKDLKFVKDIIEAKFRNEDIRKSVINEPVKLVKLNHDFSSIGKIISPILYISKKDVLRIHEELVSDFSDFEDPIYPSGLKNEHLLDSALFHPQTSFSGKIKYSTVESAGAALVYALSNNHAFHNGNKRTSIVALLVFLDKHNICLNCSEDELFRQSIKIADHKLVEAKYLYSDAEIFELSRWIHGNSKLMIKGERPITLKKFRQILTHFDCNILDNGKISRTRATNSIFGITRKKLLTSKRSIESTISDGDDVDKSLIKSIREDLELDPANGVDSDMFYAKTEFSSSEFIMKYKNLLRRLSRV